MFGTLHQTWGTRQGITSPVLAFQNKMMLNSSPSFDVHMSSFVFLVVVFVLSTSWELLIEPHPLNAYTGNAEMSNTNAASYFPTSVGSLQEI